ncbi:MAG: DUF116 domain-containing protein [Bacillota bacterium]|nr:DUF116 domain-containing protein [Bacillota bacterium]MDW7676106.1 DUF116 domain-containing protein [Bacillota bacterium]
MAVSEQKWHTSIKATILLMRILLALLMASVGFLLWLLAGGSLMWYRLMGILLVLILIAITIITLTGIVAFNRLWYNKIVPSSILTHSEMYLHWLYPILTSLGKLLGKDQNEIRRAYAQLNNQTLLNSEKKYAADEMLILTPHCLQLSDCGIKITNDIHLCQECGACNIAGLLSLQHRYGVETVVVTGGTLARKRIQEKNPALVIAIACERDLISGLMDVQQIPVYALINERPEGPCLNTRVDLDEVESVIKRFLRGGKT